MKIKDMAAYNNATIVLSEAIKKYEKQFHEVFSNMLINQRNQTDRKPIQCPACKEYNIYLGVDKNIKDIVSCHGCFAKNNQWKNRDIGKELLGEFVKNMINFYRKKPMHNFKVGDRVAFYDCIRIKGTIKEDLGHKFVIVEDRKNMEQENARYYHVHYKQCRKLKKRERRRLWLNPTGLEKLFAGEYPFSDAKIIPTEGCIEFVEARKK